ncbi:MAG: allantoicase [Gammaproteobacteria bacterium]|nr:allantoicase [Gammaproteobacteria bacterium]
MNTKVAEDNPFRRWINLAQPRLGAEVVYATDEFFASRERLISPLEPIFIADKYDEHGKWMDGWESRRRRDAGYDYCIVRLAVPGVVYGFDIDTAHFTGNYPPSASIDGCVDDNPIPGDAAAWEELVPSVRLRGNSHHYHASQRNARYTHLRLNIYPDGGVARLRVYGEVRPDWQALAAQGEIDLLAMENGGRALICNDEHFGSMHNLIAPGRGVNMGDGWETQRRRTPGYDWVILALGTPGIVKQVVIDTAHFKGNYPDRASLRGVRLAGGNEDELAAQSLAWLVLLPEMKLTMDAEHSFTDELQDIGPVSHVRLSIFPDGGVSRLRLFGRPAADT